MNIGNKVHQLRKISGMTQEQLSEKLNVSRQTISKWESGNTSPDLESIVKISKIFHVIGWFANGRRFKSDRQKYWTDNLRGFNEDKSLQQKNDIVTNQRTDFSYD